jgi:hypothetical protein
LQAAAKPGGICISDDAYRQVKSRLDLKVSELGTVPLKNISEPMRAYSLEVGAPAEARPTRTAERVQSAPKRRVSFAPYFAAIAALLVLVAAPGGSYFLGGRLTKPAPAPRLSIVVLPFANLSGGAAQDYFGDVLTEELTTSLSRLPDTFVVSRTTAFVCRGKAEDVKAIGKELGVRYALEGSAQKRGARLSPRDPLAYGFLETKGIGLFSPSRYDEAAEAFRQAVAVNSELAEGYAMSTASLAMMGHDDDAREMLRHYLALSTGAKSIAQYRARQPYDNPFLRGL